jgi:hypothetical protein
MKDNCLFSFLKTIAERNFRCQAAHKSSRSAELAQGSIRASRGGTSIFADMQRVGAQQAWYPLGRRGRAAGRARQCWSTTGGCGAQPGAHEDERDEGAVEHRSDKAHASGSAPPAFFCLAVRKRAPHGLGGWAGGGSIRRTREVAALAARSPTAFFLAIAALLLCHTGQAGAKNADWPYVGNSRLLTVAGETIDTTMAASVLNGRATGRRGEFENASFAQYYVQLRPGVDPQEFHRVSFPRLTMCRVARG